MIEISGVKFGGSDVVHFATSSQGGEQIDPSCGTRIGRYAVPQLVDAEDVSCRKCRQL